MIRQQRRPSGASGIPKRRWAALFLAGLVLVGGCTSARRASDARLARHPIHETRISNHPGKDYVPTGVWRVRGVHNTVYLVATSHVIADDAIPFPSSFYAAYGDSRYWTQYSC